jgi:hypothetical protein
MKISRVTICILFICAILITTAQPIRAEILYQATQSGTPGTATQSSTGTSSTPSQTYTPTMTPSETATTTLIPLPEITLIFPVSTPSPTATMTLTPVSPVKTPQYSSEKGLKDLSPRYKLLAVLIAILWLILIGFIILYIRQFR